MTYSTAPILLLQGDMKAKECKRQHIFKDSISIEKAASIPFGLGTRQQLVHFSNMLNTLITTCSDAAWKLG